MSNDDELLKLENDISLSNEGIYFAVYDNAFTKNFYEDELIKRLEARNISVLIINEDKIQLGKTLIDIQKNIDINTAFFSHPPLDRKKFMQYTENLNYTRDFFKDIKYPVIIWVSNEDLHLIIENAPDFWAWRSRVVSFRSKRDKKLFEFEKDVWKEKVSDELIDSIEKDLHRFEIQNDLFEVAKTSASLADLYFRTGKWDRSIQFYYKSLETFEKLGDVHGIGQTYNNMGLVYARKGEWDKAIEIYEKSLETKEKVGEIHGMGQTYNNMGLLYARKGEWNKAIEFHEKDLKISENVGDVHGMGQTYNNLGLVYARKGEWDKAIKFYKKSLETLEKVSDVHGMAQTYGNLGSVYLQKGEWDKAIKFHEKSLETKEKAGEIHGMGQTYNNMGLVYARKGEWNKTIEFYEKSLEILEKVGDVHGMAQTYGNFGSVYFQKGEWDKAIKFYEKSLETLEKVGDVHGMAQTYNNLGLVYADKAEWDKAIEFYEKSLETLKKVGDVHGMGITYYNIGILYLENSELQQAKENLEKSIELIHHDARPYYPNALNWLALCYTRLAEQKKSMSINDTKNRKSLIEKASAYYSCAAEKYQETYHLYLARMPESLLVDSHIARALSIAILNPFIKNDLKAIEGLDSAISELEKAIEYADDEAKIKIEGSILGHKARKNVRMVSVSDNQIQQDKLLDEIIQDMKAAAKKFEEIGDKGREMDCKGCACLYEGLQHLHNGLKPDNPQDFVRARKKFKESEECYLSAESKLGAEIIEILNDELTPKMEELLDYIDEKIQNNKPITRKERGELFSGILGVLEQVSFSGLSNLFHAYIFDQMLDYSKEKMNDEESTIDKSTSSQKKKEPIPVYVTNPQSFDLKKYILEAVVLSFFINLIAGISLFFINEDFFNEFKFHMLIGLTALVILVLFILHQMKKL